MEKKTIIVFRWVITVGMLIISLWIWGILPNKVPIHFTTSTPDSYGNKCILLILFLLNLSTFIPWRSEKIEFHSNDITEEMVKLMQVDEDKKIECFHLLYAVVMSFVTLALLIAVYSHI